MKTDADYDRLFTEICAQWNKAELAIKQAEQANTKIHRPAIYELRYAGRRIIEAYEARVSGDLDKACDRLTDALFDCCRAQHDAIDAITAKISQSVDSSTKRMSPNIVVSVFPKFPELYAQLEQVREKISASRANRDDRDAVYDSIASVDLPKLVSDYRDFKSCVPLMKRQVLITRWGVLGAILIAAIGGIIGGIALNLFGFSEPTQASVEGALELSAPE